MIKIAIKLANELLAMEFNTEKEKQQYKKEHDVRPETKLIVKEKQDKANSPNPIRQTLLKNYENSSDMKRKTEKAVTAIEGLKLKYPKELIEKKAQEFSQRSKERIERSSLYTRVPAEKVKKIIEDGRLKNCFETKRSMGSDSVEYRRGSEREYFGFGADYDDKKRPIYGFLGEHPKDGLLETYGEVSFKLKADKKGDSTYCYGDSLEENRVCNSCDDFNVYTAGDKNFAEFIDKGDFSMDYIEAQIHNGVSVDDIDTVYFPSTWALYYKDEEFKNLCDLLNQKNIKIDFIKGRAKKKTSFLKASSPE